MSVRNTIRLDVEEAYYHVYNRGVNKRLVFCDDADKDRFLALIGRYFSYDNETAGLYKNFSEKLEILSFCLMDNHYHLLFFQKEPRALKDFMQALTNSYVSYFNRRHQRRGPLFESRYKASLIQGDTYLEHISRYIHLNPKDWQTFPYSSIHSYLGSPQFSWLQPDRVLKLFDDTDYLSFMKDYGPYKSILDLIKREDQS